VDEWMMDSWIDGLLDGSAHSSIDPFINDPLSISIHPPSFRYVATGKQPITIPPKVGGVKGQQVIVEGQRQS
jgi:hypothetical protein